MNWLLIFYYLAQIIALEGIFMIIPFITGIYFHEFSAIYFLPIILAGILLGLIARTNKPQQSELYAKEGMIIVTFGWLLLSIIGALPFYLSGEVSSFIDALFETMSGFTTTGASVINNIDGLSRGLIMWRSLTHWLGGMGILVFLLAVIPLSSGALNLMKAESPGPTVSKLVPKLRTTAFWLYAIYSVMTIFQIFCLIFARMPLFDAICMSFGTAGTGGFAIHNNGVANYTTLQQALLAIFMLLFGVNFSAYFLIVSKKFKESLQIEEVRAYFLIVAVAVGLIFINTLPMYRSAFEALHCSFFQVSSIITTTGLANYDYNYWPQFSKYILLILMFIGACAGSTGGGTKVGRWLILFKAAKNNLLHAVKPHSVKQITVDGKKVDEETLNGIYSFFIVYTLVFVLSILIISFDNFDFTTNFSAIAATINNIGPGLELVGPMANFSIYSPLSKLVMTFDMLAGRLEMIPVLALVIPATWRR